MLLFSSKESFSWGLCPSLKILTRNSKQALTNPTTSVSGRAAWSSPLRTQGPWPAPGKACPDPDVQRKKEEAPSRYHPLSQADFLNGAHNGTSWRQQLSKLLKTQGLEMGERESSLLFFLKTKLASGSWHLTRSSRSYIFCHKRFWVKGKT